MLPEENYVKSCICYSASNTIIILKFLPETATCILEITPISKQLRFSEET